LAFHGKGAWGRVELGCSLHPLVGIKGIQRKLVKEGLTRVLANIYTTGGHCYNHLPSNVAIPKTGLVNTSG